MLHDIKHPETYSSEFNIDMIYSGLSWNHIIHVKDVIGPDYLIGRMTKDELNNINSLTESSTCQTLAVVSPTTARARHSPRYPGDR